MVRNYDHKKIEKNWQKEWLRTEDYLAEENSKKPKRYVLDMFPYPSGDGLHVGHVESYTATDIYSRFSRMKGFNVLHPIGWDAFGLPAENYAIKTGVHPKETTKKAIANFTEQINSLGLSYDWSREIGTHTPEYYKWTQWLFLTLFKNGLAEKKKAKVNWCPKDNTVLANEQVVDGMCERCGTAVIQKDLEQWFFKITQFADALHDDLETVDWPESTKAAQRNWIGRSEGAHITFSVKDTEEQITVFTTRPDTLFGATYLVLAPEHRFITDAFARLTNKNEVDAYCIKAKNRTDLERTADAKEKTGIKLEGVVAINPATNEEIPIYVADYVLGTYGTGAIMAVPAHDERDFEFAQKFALSVKTVIESEAEDAGLPYTGVGTLTNSGEFDGIQSEEAKKKITKSVGGKMVTTYRLRDWLVSRQRYWGAPIPVVYDPDGRPHAVPEEHLPWLLPEDVEFKPTGVSPLGQSKELKERTEKIFGEGWTPEVDTMDTFVCSSWYFFRYVDSKNDHEFASKHAIEEWLPVDLYIGGAEHTVLHLLYSRFFTKALQQIGYLHFNEPFLKLRHQGTILAEDGRKMSKSLGNVVNPNEPVELYGADTLRIFEMFMGPLDAAKPWNTKGIMGPRRFIERVWRLQEKIAPEGSIKEETLHELHKTIKKVGEDYESLAYNTAISQLMILLNAFESELVVPKEHFETYLKLLAPLAPHIAEELWHEIGNTTSIHKEQWPHYDEAKLVRSSVKIAVQIDSKVRAEIEVSADADKESLEALAKEAVSARLEGAEIARVVVVPQRLVNFVLKK